MLILTRRIDDKITTTVLGIRVTKSATYPKKSRCTVKKFIRG
jgi:hypothetical protein